MSGVAFQEVWRGEVSDYVTAIAWSPEGDRLVSAAANGELVVWMGDRPVQMRSSDGYSLDTVAFSHDGQWLASAGQFGTVMIWDMSLAMPQCVASLENSRTWIDHLAWHPDRHHLAFSLSKYVQIWDADTQSIVATLPFEESSVLGLQWHPGGDHLAIAGYQGVKVWNTLNWEDDPYFLEIPSASVTIAWSPQGQYLAAGNLDCTIAVLEWNNPNPWVMRGFPGKIRQLVWSDVVTLESNAPLLAASSIDGVVVWEKILEEDGWDGRVLARHEGMIQAMQFQPQQRLLATAADDGYVGLWQEAATLQQILEMTPKGVSCLAWHSQGDRLAAGGQAGEVVVWRDRENNLKPKIVPQSE